MFYAKFFLVIRAVKKFGQAIGSAQDYIEEFNYFSVALDKVGKDSANQFKKAGYNSAEEYAGSFRKRFGKLQKQLTGYDVDYNTGDATNTFSHNLGKKIGDYINGFLEEMGEVRKNTGLTGWQELGKTISDGITGILDTIDTALSTVDWWEVGKAIGDFLSEIEWGKTLLKVGKIIVKALFSALKVAISAFARDPLGIAFKLSTVIAVSFSAIYSSSNIFDIIGLLIYSDFADLPFKQLSMATIKADIP